MRRELCAQSKVAGLLPPEVIVEKSRISLGRRSLDAAQALIQDSVFLNRECDELG